MSTYVLVAHMMILYIPNSKGRLGRSFYLLCVYNYNSLKSTAERFLVWAFFGDSLRTRSAKLGHYTIILQLLQKINQVPTISALWDAVEGEKIEKIDATL